jgi:transcriptional regulator of aroF, aroG, tyrA and aromatic amino acid transport
MGANLKLEIIFADRVGIVANIATLMAEQEVNILSMEVEVQKNRAIVYLEVEADDSLETPGLIARLKTIPTLLDIGVIQTLPQEKREKRFRVVLDSISDGILAIDERGRVTAINRVAEQMLDCDAGQVVGRELRQVQHADLNLLDCLEGETFHNQKRNLIGNRGRYQFLASSRIIRDSRDRIVGAVEIMRDLKEIREAASAVSNPAQVTFGDMIGQSPAIQAAIAFAQKIARTEAVVCLRGESGTGKELFAGAIHTESGRRGLFVPVNCAALPESLLESELFGYVGGAFSGARKEGKAGLFEIAREGTLFLDEIAEMPLSLQAKMLRVLQEGKVRRVGGSHETPVDVRLITATNKDLERMVTEQTFREDLYYRINVFPIHLPPLRARTEDIPVMAEHFLFQFNTRLGKDAQTLTPEALDELCRHPWPGNVRELRNVIERAAILCSTAQIGDDCLLFGAGAGTAMVSAERGGRQLASGESLPAMVDRFEKQLLTEALSRNRSIRKVAARLGVSHTTLLNKIKKYGLNMARK